MCGRDFHVARSMLNGANSVALHEPSKEFQWLIDIKYGRAMISSEVEPNFASRSGNPVTIRCQEVECDQDLDLDLSLNIGSKKAKRERDWEEEIDSSLSLSLLSSSRQDQKCSRDVGIKNSEIDQVDEEDYNGENERVISTLDLTI